MHLLSTAVCMYWYKQSWSAANLSPLPEWEHGVHVRMLAVYTMEYTGLMLTERKCPFLLTPPAQVCFLKA